MAQLTRRHVSGANASKPTLEPNKVGNKWQFVPYPNKKSREAQDAIDDDMYDVLEESVEFICY